MRRGITELNGQGETVGGVVILRAGKNARETITAVKAKLAELQQSLPKGVQVVPVYDRSKLIDRAVENLSHKLIEEFIVVALVCGLFLWHLRSAMVAIVSLPLGILSAFLVMYYQGLNANIMSLGIAIAIGAMVDAAVVMVENAHKHIETWQHGHPNQVLETQARWNIIARSASEVGPALFFCLLYYLIFYSYFYFTGTRRTFVLASGVYQNLCHGSGSWFIHYPDSCFDGLLDPWEITLRTA